MSNFGLSPYNYLEQGPYGTLSRAFTSTPTPLHRYDTIGLHSGGTFSFTNSLPVDAPVGMLAMGNCLVSGNVTATVSISGVGSFGAREVFNNTNHHPNQVTTIGGVNVVKYIPRYIGGANTYEVPPGQTLTVTVTGVTNLGWAWIGPYRLFDRGFKKPSSVSINGKEDTVELENGDIVRSRMSLSRDLSLEIEAASEDDREFCMNNLRNGRPYILNCFYDGTDFCQTPHVDVYLEYLGLMVMNTPLAITPKIYDLYNYSLKFKEYL